MGFVVKAVKKVVKAVVGVVTRVAGVVLGFSTGKKSTKSKAPNTLNKTLEPEAFRKAVLGKTAAVCDQRFWEVWGTKGTNFDEVVAVACHRINGFKELYFETDLAIDAAGVVQAKYAGILTRDTRLGAPGQTAMSVGSGTQWTSTATFDGVPHMKLAWLPDDKRLPNGIPDRYTQIIEGALVYDPRRDSTVPGGSGSHRINDQSTWSYATLDSNGQPIGRNNCLQSLWYLLGWRVQNPSTGEWVLVFGRGVDPQDINLATFIAGANACEAAAYYTDVVLTSEDEHTANEEAITCNGLIGRLIDPGGLWSYYANVDDTANIAVELTDNDIIEGVNVSWNSAKGMSEQFNQVRGKFIYPASPVLYQAFPYPMVRDAVYETNLGVKRAKTQDFRQVLDSTLAQRLARLKLNEGQYQGEFQAGFNYRMMKAQGWSVVRYTSERFGWTKLFRVWRHEFSMEAGCVALLKEIHPSIWTAGTVTGALAPATGALYNPAQEIAATGVNVALYPVVGANGDKGDGFRVYWDLPATNVRRTEVRYRLVGTAYWETAGPVARDVTEIICAPLLSGAVYEVAVRHISIHEVPGPWINPTTAPANGAGQFQLGATGTINYAAIAAAGGTAVWASITGAGKPANNADVTGANIAAGFTGSGTLAYESSLPYTAIEFAPGNLILDPQMLRSGSYTNLTQTTLDTTPANFTLLGANRALTNTLYPAAGNMNFRFSNSSVSPGKRYQAGFLTLLKAGYASNLLLTIRWYKRDGTASAIKPVSPTSTNSFNAAADIVVSVLVEDEAPADAYYGRLEALNQHNAGGQTYTAYPFFVEMTLASNVSIGNTNNIIADPNFEDPNGWSYGNAVRLPNTANNKGTGKYKLRLDASVSQIQLAKLVEVPPSQPLYVSCYCETISGTTGSLLCQVLFYKADLTAVASGNFAVMTNAAGASGRFPITGLVPSDAAYARFRWFRNTAGDRIWEVSEPIMRPATRIGTDMTLADGTTKPTDNTLVTSLGVSSGFTGQTLWATAATSGGLAVTPTEAFNRVQNINTSGNLAAITNIVNRRMTLLFRADGSTAVTETDLVTSMGVSSGFSGQTLWATAPTSGGSNRSPTEVFGRVSLIGNNGRVADPTAYNTQFIVGPRNVTNLVPTYTVGGSDVTVNLPAHNRVITGASGPVTLAYGAMSATWPFSSYWAAYVDDPNLAGIASPTVTLTANPNDLLYPGRYQVASGVTPSSGGTGGGTGGGGGGGGGWDNCVAVESFMPSGGLAMEVRPGDRLLGLDHADYDRPAWIECTANLTAQAECVEIETESGARLILSASTPCTLYGGHTVNAEAVLGYELAVQDAAGYRWEQVTKVTPAGQRAVSRISAKEGTYAAGLERGRYIFTHNGTAKP